ncbi:MAG: hypothetical protein K8M05_25335 [Deltaproteobacteria bacterium]|nr:hypothetical protein [Kofleriaceae bacterium]
MESEPRPARLPVCILATAGDERADVVCVRLSCAGIIETLFAIEGGVATASYHRADTVETMDAVPPEAETVAEMVGEAADGALLVTWELERTFEALRRFHPSPDTFLARAALDVELSAAAALVGLLDDIIDPTIEQLAERMSLSPPVASARERATFLIRVVRILAASGVWLSHVLALGGDERSILAICARRLAEGKQAYGEWRLDDGRDFAREAYEEVIDGLHYAAAGLLKLQEHARHREVR